MRQLRFRSNFIPVPITAPHGYYPSAAARGICGIEGEDVVNQRTAQRWFTRLCSGNLTLVEHSGEILGIPVAHLYKILRLRGKQKTNLVPALAD
ncbi:hypothetical protein EVAR_12732_1 [Eumeta japonica]|uniref:Mos1 transposase HTH domain-containing protein n=1 Tax=Eumeta variegata TaxID=151549 RepID=A0A4C1UNY3_EUMVA|nr:hypothetical protein EVAR_12732_1 [Eumeta japonica]